MKKYAPSILRTLIVLAICHLAFHGEEAPFIDYCLMGVFLIALKMTDALEND